MANTSGGRDETGESALRRDFNARMDSSNDLISASIESCKRSRDFAWLEFIEKWNGVPRVSRAWSRVATFAFVTVLVT